MRKCKAISIHIHDRSNSVQHIFCVSICYVNFYRLTRMPKLGQHEESSVLSFGGAHPNEKSEHQAHYSEGSVSETSKIDHQIFVRMVRLYPNKITASESRDKVNKILIFMLFGGYFAVTASTQPVYEQYV